MNHRDTYQAASFSSNSKSLPFAWVRSVLMSAFIILLVGGSAILLGRNEQRPVDWVYVNAIQEKQNVQLPDGSQVWLRKGSSLGYPSNFGKKESLLQLKGEAYFEFLKNPTMPLSVNGMKGITSEKGTSFFIRSNDSMQMLMVSKGRVKLESGTKKGEYVILNSGETAALKGNSYVQSRVENLNDFAWTNERLIFDRASLEQVAKDLNNFYGIPVLIAPDINSHEFEITAQFDNQPLPRILQEISSQTGLTVKNKSDSFLISQPEVVDAREVVDEKEEAKKLVSSPAPVKETTPVVEKAKKKKKKWWKFWKKK